MSYNEHTPEWVVENFLPDYEERLTTYLKEFFNVDDAGRLRNINSIKNYFCNNHFPEALEHLLKAQRNICQEVLNECFEFANDSDEQLSQFEYMYRKEPILSAPIPEPIKE